MWRYFWSGAVALLVIGAGALPAQTGRQRPSPKTVATRQDWFSIPFQIAAAGRAERQAVEVQLFVSDDDGRTWQLHDRVAPDAGQVSFQAPGDGKYCFCVRTLDRARHLHPGGDFHPEMIVVVDTTSPEVELSAERDRDGNLTANWKIEEQHLDKNSFLVEYRVGSETEPWQPLDIDPLETDASGAVHAGSATWWSAADLEDITIRVTAGDIAGNRAANNSLLAAVRDGEQEFAANRRDARRPTDEFGHMRRPADTRAASLPHRENRSFSESDAAPNRTVVDPVHPPVRQQFGNEEGPKLTGAGDLPPGEHPRMVSTVRFELEYEVESVGPSGIGRVELWGTEDGGDSWRHFATDPDNRSPLPVSVDGEGLYGFRIVVESGNGLRGSVPRAGDRPQMWVGVDLSQPQAELISVEQGTGDEAGLLLIQWQADDAQLAARPISLSIAEDLAGPWSAIASGLPNTGRFSWLLDNRAPDEIYVRLEVRDEAGNVRVVDSSRSVVLNRARPQGNLRGVRPLRDSAGANHGVIHNPYYR